MYFDEFKHQLPDIDPDETDDWLPSLDQVVEQAGETRARFLVYKLLKRARQLQIGLPPLTQTRYINTISPEQEPTSRATRRSSCAFGASSAGTPSRWSCAQHPVHRHRRPPLDLRRGGGLYEVGFNHFFRGKDGEAPGTRFLPGPRRAGCTPGRSSRGGGGR